MSKTVIGYAGTIAGVLVGLLTLASLGDAHPNYLVSAVLTMFTIALLGVGWYGLRVDAPAAESERREEAEEPLKEAA
jgi:hypothetical protein